MNRARSSLRSSADNFIQDKKWFSWYQSVPMGYEEEDNGSWIQRIDDLEPVIRDIYNHFLDEKSYEKVARIVTEKHRDRLVKYDIIQAIETGKTDDEDEEDDEENKGLH